jgi:uncharacterized protein
VEFENTFTIPVDVEQAWSVLLDIEKVAPCMPGATLETVEGDNFTGTVKVRLGPIALTYKGKASFIEKDPIGHRVVLDAQGKDARGNGTASAKVTATLVAEGKDTRVAVFTDLNVTGKPAQFGRGVMVDVGNKLIRQFADCLASKLSGGGTNGEPSGAGQSEDVAVTDAATTQVVPEPAAEVEPIDLLGSAGPAIAKRLVPVVLSVLVILLVLRHKRRRLR